MTNQQLYHPENAEDALKKIQQLFNSYRKAPLTEDLLRYHEGLVQRLTGDIPQAARAEQRDDLVVAAATMVRTMRGWTTVRLAGQPFNGRLRHFKFVADAQGPTFKRRVIKNHGTGSHRSSRHG